MCSSVTLKQYIPHEYATSEHWYFRSLPLIAVFLLSSACVILQPWWLEVAEVRGGLALTPLLRCVFASYIIIIYLDLGGTQRVMNRVYMGMRVYLPRSRLPSNRICSHMIYLTLAAEGRGLQEGKSG